MGFVTALALAVGLLVALPLIAHMLRRGKAEEHEFPPAMLVLEQATTSRQRSRLEDRVLLSLRALAILALALLGATPLARCSRLNVARPAGASVALALVIDDSQSMRSQVSEGQRWELALVGARQLLSQARSGDSVAIIRAGRPARVALSPTSDLTAAAQTLTEMRVTDRNTDLGNAVRLAQTLLKPLPQLDKRVIVLSDLADTVWDSTSSPISAPLHKLREQAHNCAVTEAEQQGEAISFTVACNSAQAAQARTASVVSLGTGTLDAVPPPNAESQAPASPQQGAAEGSVALPSAAGVHTLQLRTKNASAQHEIVLIGGDANAADDRAIVARQSGSLSIGVAADPTKAMVITGGATVIEQALSALEHQITIKPLSLVPETSNELQTFALLVIDDPAGLSPEARTALAEWLQRGGVAVGLLGPNSQSVQLASNLEPFAKGGQWERLTAPLDAKEAGAAWLPTDTSNSRDLSRTGRMRLDGAELPKSTIALRWADGVPLILERDVGAGVVLTCGLPASVEVSELALRPLFLSLFDHTLSLAEARRGPSKSRVGTPWYFRSGAVIEVKGPDGLLPPPHSAPSLGGDATGGSPEESRPQLSPELAGAYRVTADGQVQHRVVTLDPEEVTRLPVEPPDSPELAGAAAQSQVDISREIALVLLALLTLELMVRVLGPLVLRQRITSR